MIGKHNGLAKLLNDAVDKNLYQVHCLGHRLHLAAGHCFKEIETLKTFEKDVNLIYSFYNNNAVKKKNTLRATASALNQQLYELAYIFDIRWVAAETSALVSLRRNLKTCIVNLQSLQADNSFDLDSRNTASGIETKIRKIRWYSLLLFLIDILKVLASASQHFQRDPRSGGLVIGMETFRSELIKSISKLKEENGPEIHSFLLRSRCRRNAE